MNARKNGICLLGGIAFLPTASAYIDPGTAGMIAGGLGSGIWAAIIMVGAGISGFLVRYFWEPITSLFGKGSKTKETTSSEKEKT